MAETTTPTSTKGKKPYYAKINDSTYVKFQGSPAIYDPLKETLGVGDAPPQNALVLTGILPTSVGVSKLTVVYRKSGTANGADEVFQSGHVYCETSKLTTALTALRTKTYKGKDITEARTARKRIFV